MANANWIDVSYFQDPNKFDYQAAKQAGIQGLIIRAGYGKTQDTAAAQHIANAQKYGFMWHLYHYWYNMGGEAEWAVQNAKSLGLTANQYLFLDMEDKSLPADWNGQFAVFRKAVGDTYKVGLYCSDSPYKAKFQDSQLQQLKVARWVASYSYEPANYDIWQMSGAGSGGFGSYTGDIDRDYTKSDILSLYATTNINPVVTKPTADLQYIQPIMLQPGYDTETNIYGLGYSPDNGVHFYVTYTTFGAKYRQEDADRLWKYLQGFVSKQIASAVSLTWDNIKGKPDLVLRNDLPDFNQFALKNDLPAPVDLSGYAKTDAVEAVKATAESALSKAEEAQSTADANSKALADKANKSEIPDISGLAKKSDIPVLPDLNSYALKSELPSLSGYARLSDIPSVAGLVKEAELADYAKKSDIPAPVDLSGYAKTDVVDAVKTTAESALSTAEKAQSTANANSKALADKADKSAIPSLDGYAKLTDIPSVTGLVKEAELAEYAKKSDIPKLPDLSGYATVASLVDYAKRAELPDFTQFARKSELPVVPTDLVHTADLDKAKADIAKAQQMANDAVTFANNARVTIDTTDLHQIKKPSEYSEGFSYEVKALSDLGIDLTKYDTSVQNGWIGLVKSVQVSVFNSVYVTQTVRVLGSYRPTTFIRNGSGDSWYPFELVTTW